MSCGKYLDLISARLDGALSPEDEHALTAHLSQCPACRAIAEDMNGLHSALSHVGQVDAPADLSQAVLSKIQSERQQTRHRMVRRLATLAACLVLCVGVVRIADATYFGHDRHTADPGLPGVARHMEPIASTDELPYSGEQRLRLSAMSTSFTPSADLLDNADDFSRYIARFPYDDLSALAQTYNEEYFRSHRLLAVVVCEPSSSITHTVSALTPDSVTIVRNVPEAGDSDISLWLLLVPTELAGPERALEVHLIDQ